jgi:hypothetical protein
MSSLEASTRAPPASLIKAAQVTPPAPDQSQVVDKNTIAVFISRSMMHNALKGKKTAY